MEKYETLEHRGDFKIRAFDKTKEELFLNALLGMEAGLRLELKLVGVRHLQACRCLTPTRNLEIKSLDLNALLVDFLSEVLYLIQTNKEIYDKVNFTKFTDSELKADPSGQVVERFDEDIKAVTYHGLDIHQRDNGFFEATILFDI